MGVICQPEGAPANDDATTALNNWNGAISCRNSRVGSSLAL